MVNFPAVGNVQDDTLVSHEASWQTGRKRWSSLIATFQETTESLRGSLEWHRAATPRDAAGVGIDSACSSM